MSVIGFSPSDAARISSAVRRVERMPQGGVKQRRKNANTERRTKVRGKLDGTLSQGGSATLSVWRYDGSESADTGENITVHDWFLGSGETFATGKEVTAHYFADSNRWYCTTTECCEDACPIGNDTFDGTLSQFTETGTPSVAGGLLEMDAGDAVVFTPEPTGGEDDAVVVETTPRATDGDPATYRIEVAKADASNLVFAEFNHPAAGGATVRLGHVIDGVSSYVTEAVDLPSEADEQDERFTAKVCWQPGAVVAGETGLFTDVKYPAAVIPSGSGWTNDSNALLPFADDSAYAEHALPPGPPYNSDIINFSGFFTAADLPPSAVVDGIAIDVVCRSIPGESSPDIMITRVELFDDEPAAYEDKGDNQVIAEDTFTNYGYGDSTDDWGVTLDRDFIADPGFGVTVGFEWTNGTGDLHLDVVEAQAWYHTLDERQPGIITVVVGDLLVSGVAEGAGPKTGLRVTAGTVDFDDYVLKNHKGDSPFTACPDCEPTIEVSCEPDETEDVCDESGFPLHDGEPFEGGGSTVSIENPSGTTIGFGTYAWCYDWSPGLAEGGYISLKATISYSAGTGIATVGIGFGTDTDPEHQCGGSGQDEVPGGHCPGLLLIARPLLDFEDNPGSSYGYSHVEGNSAGAVDVEPSPGDELEIRITCESGQLISRMYVNDGLIITHSGVILPNPLNYTVANTLADNSESSCEWSNIQFTYVPSAP